MRTNSSNFLRLLTAFIVLFAVGCATGHGSDSAGATVSSSDAEEGGWRQVGSGATTVLYRPGFESDAEEVLESLRTVRRRLDSAFSVDTEGLSETIRVEVRLYPGPGDTVRAGLVETRSQVDGERVDAQVAMLSPSAHPEEARTKANLPMDAAYIEKTLVHEYAGLVLAELARQNGGRRIYDRPNWFVQGYQEYLAIRYGPERAREKVFPAYLERVDAADLVEDSTFAPSDPYVGGAVVVAYLHDAYGEEPMRCLVKSDEPAFRRAFEACFGGALESAVEKFSMDAVSLP